MLDTGVAEPDTDLVMTDGEPDHEILRAWEFLFQYPEQRLLKAANEDAYIIQHLMRCIAIKVRSSGCEPLYVGEPIGIRFQYGKFKSLCHSCYVQLLVHGSVPTLVNLCVAQLFNEFVEARHIEGKRPLGRITEFRMLLKKKSGVLTRLVHPDLAKALVDIANRLEPSFCRFGKDCGGGNDYNARNEPQHSIPLPILCIGSSILPEHWTIYPAYLLHISEWKHFRSKKSALGGEDPARFQCIHCRKSETYHFPKINYLETELGYGCAPFQSLYRPIEQIFDIGVITL